MSDEPDVNKVIAEILLQGAKKAKDKLTNMIDEHNYGFSADAETFDNLAKIGQQDVFKRLKECVGKKYSPLKFIRLGLYLSELNKKGERQKLQGLKDNVFNHHGKTAINIANMGTTGVISHIIRYLSDLKMDLNYTQEELVKELDKVIDEWENITLFVKESDSKEQVKKWICKLIDAKIDLFFVFGYGSAREIAKKAIADLNNDQQILQKDYLFYADNPEEAGKMKISVIFRRISKFNLFDGVFTS